MVLNLTIPQVLEITSGQLIGKFTAVLISKISIDSRQILQPDQTLFVALRGAKADGAAPFKN